LITDDEAGILEHQLKEEVEKPINELYGKVEELRKIVKSHNHEIGGVWTSTARWTP